MAGIVGTFFKNAIGGALKNDNVRDYKHAAKTFSVNNYALTPKTKRSWHVVFDFNPEAIELVNSLRSSDMNGGSYSSGDNSFFGSTFETARIGQPRMSALVKTVKLPSYKFETKRLNQYNRQILVINKISYDPIQLTFHDDAIGIIRSFWDAYYTYYVQDARYRKMSAGATQGLNVPDQWQQDNKSSGSSANYSSLYTNDLAQHWGMDTTSSSGTAIDRITPFFNWIKIYQFSRPSGDKGHEGTSSHYDEYTLINPIITSFAHDQGLDYSSSDFCSNEMSIEYETVLYNRDELEMADETNTLASWNSVRNTYYDRDKSPLGNPSASIGGVTGLFATASSLLSGNLNAAQSILTIGRTVETWKDSGGIAGLANAATSEGLNAANGSLAQVAQNASNGSSLLQNITVPLPQGLLKSLKIPSK